MYGAFLILALVTSLLNHGSTSSIIKWLDRSVMYMGSIITLYQAPNNSIRALVPCIGGFYFLAKYYNSNIFHILSHICITGINVGILILHHAHNYTTYTSKNE
jgi:hypothetical protein